MSCPKNRPAVTINRREAALLGQSRFNQTQRPLVFRLFEASAEVSASCDSPSTLIIFRRFGPRLPALSGGTVGIALRISFFGCIRPPGAGTSRSPGEVFLRPTAGRRS